MIEGAIWRKWVFFYVPMGLFLLFLLFPFYWMVITSVRPDGELYRPWNSINYNPFWTWKPTWDHVRYLFEETLFASWLWNTTFIALALTEPRAGRPCSTSSFRWRFQASSRPASSLSRCPGTSSSMHLSSCPRLSRRPCRSASRRS